MLIGAGAVQGALNQDQAGAGDCTERSKLTEMRWTAGGNGLMQHEVSDQPVFESCEFRTAGQYSKNLLTIPATDRCTSSAHRYNIKRHFQESVACQSMLATLQLHRTRL